MVVVVVVVVDIKAGCVAEKHLRAVSDAADVHGRRRATRMARRVVDCMVVGGREMEVSVLV